MKDLDIKVTKYIRDCLYCQMFTQKTTRQTIEPNLVPEKCWEGTSVHLFGPLPSSHHVIVVPDLSSCTSGNPLRQKSNNGLPFNSNEMTKFPKNRNIRQLKVPPGTQLQKH